MGESEADSLNRATVAIMPDARSLPLDPAADGRNPSARLTATDGLVRDIVATRLREVLDNVSEPSQRLTVEIAVGDTPEAGAWAGAATHTAVLSLDGTEVLGLRVVHRGSRDDIAIIGFWLPG